MQNLSEKTGGENGLNSVIQAISELVSAKITPIEKIEAIAQSWPENFEVSVLEMHSIVCKALKELGWGDGVGERRWYDWINFLSPVVPTDRTPSTIEFNGRFYREHLRLDGIAFRELLYQGFYRFQTKRNSTAKYLTNRLKRLGV